LGLARGRPGPTGLPPAFAAHRKRGPVASGCGPPPAFFARISWAFPRTGRPLGPQRTEKSAGRATMESARPRAPFYPPPAPGAESVEAPQKRRRAGTGRTCPGARLYTPRPSDRGRTELRLCGVPRSSQRSETSRGRGFPCSPSREEFAHGQEQARKREYDEHDLVDVIFSGRQPAYEVPRPEEWVIPQGEPSPPFSASVGDRGDQEAE
jgi:hypothetical protein